MGANTEVDLHDVYDALEAKRNEIQNKSGLLNSAKVARAIRALEDSMRQIRDVCCENCPDDPDCESFMCDWE